MAVVIRLAKVGKRGTSIYRIVAIEKRHKRDSNPLEILGSYIPKGELVTKKDRIDYWITKGATLSETMRKLLKTDQHQSAF